MITLSEDQLDQVEYLIHQSMQGHHVLFDLDRIRRVLSETTLHSFSEEDAYSVEHHIERTLGQPTLLEKKAYLAQLDETTLERVIRTYFNILENNLLENHGVLH